MKKLNLAAVLFGAAFTANADTINLLTNPALIDIALAGSTLSGVNFAHTTGTSLTGTAAGVGNITFNGDGETLESASGAAAITAQDGGFDYVDFSGPLPGLSVIYFSIYPESSTPFNGLLTVNYAPAAPGASFTRTFTVGSGRNEFLLYTSDISIYITKVTLSTEGDLLSLKQVNVGDDGPPPNASAVPEPGTYAMLGTGLAVLAARRARRS